MHGPLNAVYTVYTLYTVYTVYTVYTKLTKPVLLLPSLVSTEAAQTGQSVYRHGHLTQSLYWAGFKLQKLREYSCSSCVMQLVQ